MNQFVMSLKRLYESGNISKQKIIDMYNNNKISNEEKLYILSAH